METPTSTRELIGDEREDARDTRRFEREEGDRGETRGDAEQGGTAALASDANRTTASSGDDTPNLFPREQNDQFQSRWEKIQTGFVDEPRETVEQADELVAQVMKRVAEGFATERERLEQQWGRGEDVSTEDLRIALQRYRSFFRRLLSA